MQKASNPVTFFACNRYKEMQANPPTKEVKKCEEMDGPEFDASTYKFKKTKDCHYESVVDKKAMREAAMACEREREQISHLKK